MVAHSVFLFRLRSGHFTRSTTFLRESLRGRHKPTYDSRHRDECDGLQVHTLKAMWSVTPPPGWEIVMLHFGVASDSDKINWSSSAGDTTTGGAAAMVRLLFVLSSSRVRVCSRRSAMMYEESSGCGRESRILLCSKLSRVWAFGLGMYVKKYKTSFQDRWIVSSWIDVIMEARGARTAHAYSPAPQA